MNPRASKEKQGCEETVPSVLHVDKPVDGGYQQATRHQLE
jgi:hypothetical protein